MADELAFHEKVRKYHKDLLTDVERDVGNIVECTFASRYTATELPKDQVPPVGMPSRVAYQLIHDIRQLDANPRLNLASFVTTVGNEHYCGCWKICNMMVITTPHHLSLVITTPHRSRPPLDPTVDGARGQ